MTESEVRAELDHLRRQIEMLRGETVHAATAASFALRARALRKRYIQLLSHLPGPTAPKPS